MCVYVREKEREGKKYKVYVQGVGMREIESERKKNYDVF